MMQLTPTQRMAIAEVAKTAGVLGTAQRNPNISAFAETIVQSIEPGQLSLDLFNLFLPTQQLAEGDNFEMRIQRNMFPARPMVAGARNLADSVVTESKAIFFHEKLICGARANLNQIRNGDVPAIGELRTQLARDLMTQIASNVFNRLSTIWNETDVPDLHDTGTALTKTALDTLIANVEQRAPVRAIVGTKEALRPLFTFAGYVTVGSTPLAIPRQLQEYGDTGMVREYLGIPVVILPQVMANTLPNPSKKLVRSDIVLVIGQEAGVIGLKGEMQTQEHIDTSVQPADYYLHVWQHYGIAITARERVGMFRIV